MNPNSHVYDQVDDFVHGLLDPQAAAHVESHGVECTVCAAALASARRRMGLLQAAPTESAPEPLIQTTLTRIRIQHEQTLRRRRRMAMLVGGALAASALLLVGLHIYYANLKPSPYDLTVLGQSELLPATKAALRVRLTDRDAGAALTDVPVEVTLRGPQTTTVQVASFRTDRHGSGNPGFEVPDWADGEYELTVTAQTQGGPERLSRSVRLKRSWRVMLSSDKPVYQPGQSIRLRALALRRPDHRPVGGQAALFTVIDPHGNVIFKKSGPTSKFGITAADCPLAHEILEGAYTIACKVGDTDSRLSVEVKRYVLPKFKVDVTFDRPFYVPGDSAKLTVKAGYFFGKPVADAAVQVEVRSQGSDTNLSLKLTGRTDATGSAELSAALPPRLSSDSARLVFTVRLTDTAGQKASRIAERIVTAKPVRIDVLPEGGRLVRGVPNQIYVLLTRADGQPQPGRVAIPGLGEWATDEFGLAVFTLPSPSSEATLSLSARDLRGQLLDQRTVTLPSGDSPLDFLLTTDRAVYRGGDTLRLTALGAGSEPVFVDFLKDGQTLLSETVEMADGRGTYALDLPVELTGPIEISAYRLGVNEPSARTYRVVYVQKSDALIVKIDADRAEYRPGDKASLKVRLRDRKDQPIAGAVSLAAVDEAVFRVSGGPARIDPDEQSPLLRPIYKAYPWSPNAKLAGTPEQRTRFEHALFARTAAEDRGADREELLRDLLPFVENNPRSFRVFERPDWEELIDLSWLPKSAIEALRGGGTTHAINASTYPKKAKDIEVRRHSAQETLWRLTWGTIAIIVVVIIVRIAIGLKLVAQLAFLFFIPFLLLCLMLPAVQKVREASERAQAANDLRQLGLAFETYQLAHGSLPGQGSVSESVRVRELFPETLLWRPEIITDDDGNASLDIDLADSITTWRLTGSAVTDDGQLGAVEASIRVFQPFFVDLNLPVALTRGDEVAVPVVVSNYLDRPQRVTLTLAGGAWFERAGDAERRLDLGPHEVRSVYYRLRAKTAGTHEFLVTARSGDLADAVKRVIEVVPDGRRVEQVVNGSLRQPANLPLNVPGDAIDGSVKAVVKIYPSGFSQLVEGLDGIFRMPSGCFEQTSSTTYPNVLALDYLRRTGRSLPAVEKKAQQLIHLGYQRLVGFEVSGGGFDWFGRPPANRVLTAYGLMEFVDMARVHEVDPQLIERTRRWLLDQRKNDGSWDPEGHSVTGVAGNGNDRLAATAYIGWAVHADNKGQFDSSTTKEYLLGCKPDTIADAYTLALVANALLTLDPSGEAAAPYLDRLNALRQIDAKNGFTWWQQNDMGRTMFHGAGRGGSVETTALATLALLHGKRHPDTARAALKWLTSRRDASGTWLSTQATVLALKAILAGAEPDKSGEERRILVKLNGRTIEELVIPPDQTEVMRQIELTKQLKPGEQRLTIEEPGNGAAMYQIALRYHVPGAAPAGKAEPLLVEVKYDRTELTVGDTLQATARVVNRMKGPAAMVMLELPLAAGFVAVTEEFTGLVDAGTIARYQVEPRRVLVYLRDLPAEKPLTLNYRLRATLVGETTAPAARVYEYYDPDKQGLSAAGQLTVKARD